MQIGQDNVARALALGASGGGSGTSNYNDLRNKPLINGKVLSGNLTSSDLDLVGEAKVEEIEELIGTEKELDPRLTATNIIEAINEHEGDLVGLAAEQNHIFVDKEEQAYQYLMTDLSQYLFQDNTWFLDGETSYNVPEPKIVYAKLDFSNVHPAGADVHSNDHVFGIFKTDYTPILRLYCTTADDDDKIKVTMIQGGYTIPVDIMPTDVVGIVSGNGYHKLFVNGTLIQEIPNSAKADKILVGNADNNLGFVAGSSISYKAYVVEFDENEEKAFIAEPADVIEDIVVIDRLGKTKKYFLPKTDTSGLATKEELAKKEDKSKIIINGNTTFTAVLNSDYIFNAATPELNITLPAATAGQLIHISFLSGETATVLDIIGSIADYEAIIIKPNKYYELSFYNNGLKWLLKSSESGGVA